MMNIINYTLLAATALPVLNSNIHSPLLYSSIHLPRTFIKLQNFNKRQYSTKSPSKNNLAITREGNKLQHWENIEYKLENPSNITKALLNNYLNKFWKTIMEKISTEQHAMFILRVKFTNDQIATISHLKKINQSSKEELLQYLLSRLTLSNESYIVTPILSIIFSYGIRNGKIIPDLVIGNKETKYQIYYNNKLPIAIKPEDYGNVLTKKNNQYIISVSKDVIIILDSQMKSKTKINKIQYLKNGQILFTWTDKIINEYSFIREIGKSSYHYENGELILLNNMLCLF